MKHRGASNPRGHLLVVLVVFGLAIAWLYPTVWSLTTSLKPNSQIYSSPLSLPLPPQWQNFSGAWSQGDLGGALGNSLYVTVLSVLLVLGLAIPAAYALTSLQPFARRFAYGIVMLPLLIPSGIILVPLFFLFRTLHLIDSLNGVVVYETVVNLGLAILLLSAFFRQVPKELHEAARLDGAGKVRVLAVIVVPLARAGVYAIGLIVGDLVWNDYFGPLVFLQDPKLYTVPIALSRFTTQYTTNLGFTFSALAVAIVPALIIFVIAQRTFVRGVTVGAIRG